MMIRWLGVLAVISMLPGCVATYPTFAGPPGATQEQFLKIRYACLLETQAPQSQGHINQYGGSMQSTVAPLCSSFNACLAAQGYTQLTDAQAKPPQGSIHAVTQATAISCR